MCDVISDKQDKFQTSDCMFVIRLVVVQG